ncbi:MAG: NTP transferase domain-containing protein [Bacteroidota bacterium]|nr:NTP transferase domain-containing protein [Bacteroidota bacterium]
MSDLLGLVICGGKSLRMGTDKSRLEYHGLPHCYYLFHLLQDFCKPVYLSVNIDQAQNEDGQYPFIADADEYCNIGPMSALLSAWQRFRGASLLAVGCDYPFLNRESIVQLTKHRQGKATCFFLNENNIYEPLLTIYESSFYPKIIDNFNKQNFSLSKILEHENVNVIQLSSSMMLQNVNTPDEYFLAKKLLNM